ARARPGDRRRAQHPGADRRDLPSVPLRGRVRLDHEPAGHAGPDDPPRRLLEVVRDDRLASGLRGDAAAARRARGAADGQLELLHGVVRTAGRDRRAPGRSDAGRRHGGRVQAPPRRAGGRTQPPARCQVRAAARCVLRVPEHHGDGPVLGRGGRAPAERRRRGRPVRRGVRRPRRGLPQVLVRELRGQSEEGARSHAPGIRELREEVTRRTTVADVVVDGLQRAGTPGVIGITGERSGLLILDAARAIELPVTLASTARGACVVAAVAGDLADAPGAAVIGDAATTAILGLPERLPVILITSGRPSVIPGPKETLRVEAESAAHRIAHAARLAMTGPRGAVPLAIPGAVAAGPALRLATACRPDPLPYPALDDLDRAARALSSTTRPLLLVGAHCRSSEAAQWVRAFVEALPAPVLTTVRAKGVLPDPHPLMLGVLGAGGVERRGVEERLPGRADLVVAIGLDELEPLPEACRSAARAVVFGPAPTPEGLVPAARVVGQVSAIVEELAG